MAEVKKHGENIKAKNNLLSQIQGIVGNERCESLNEQLRKINERWEVIQGRGEIEKGKVRHVLVTWGKFRETLARLRDISEVENKVIDDDDDDDNDNDNDNNNDDDDDNDNDNDNDDDDNLFNESDVYKKYVLIRLLSRELISPRIFTIENILFIIYYMSCFIVYM